MRVDGPLYQL